MSCTLILEILLCAVDSKVLKYNYYNGKKTGLNPFYMFIPAFCGL